MKHSETISSFSHKQRMNMEKQYGQINIFEIIEENKMEQEYEVLKFNLDTFETEEAPIENMFVGFDLTKNENDDNFVITAPRNAFTDLSDFKSQFNLSEDKGICFSHKEGVDCGRMVELYEKRKHTLKVSKKEIEDFVEKEVADISASENLDPDDMDFEENLPSLDFDDKKKNKKTNKLAT